MKVLNFMLIPSKDEDLSSSFDFLSIFSVPVESKMVQIYLNFSHIISKNKNWVSVQIFFMERLVMIPWPIKTYFLDLCLNNTPNHKI